MKMEELSAEQIVNGIVNMNLDGDDAEKNYRPADIDADVRDMERRKRVEAMMASRLFKDELERIVDQHVSEGYSPANLAAVQQLSQMFGSSSRLKTGSIIPINDIKGPESLMYAKGEKLLRCKLAALYRLVDLHGWTQSIYNHITVRINQEQEHFLINPFGLLYHEVTASGLIKVDMQGNIVDPGSTNFSVNVAGFMLHSAIHQARPDVKCVIHMHLPAVIAVSAMKCGLLPLSQEACIIGPVSYHPYEGILVDAGERARIAENLGPNNKVMLLRNHGFVACGETIEEAWVIAYHTVLACEAQMKMIPIGIENLITISEDAIRRTGEAVRAGVASKSESAGVQASHGQHSIDESDLSLREEGGAQKTARREKRWRAGEMEFEAYMRMMDNAGYRTGYMYRQAIVKNEAPRLKLDVEVPPSVSSFGYQLEGEELYRDLIKKLLDGKKTSERAKWINSPNVYQKVEVLETGTHDPKKITKWVADSSPTHSTPIKVDPALQFVPVGTTQKEFKQKQKAIKENRRAGGISAGPQSHILEGVSWDEAKRMQEAAMSNGDQVIIVGAASKGIIQRDFQHHAMVYKTPYAKNPFDNISSDDLDDYKKEIERNQRGDTIGEHHGELDESFVSTNLSSISAPQQMTAESVTLPETSTPHPEDVTLSPPQSPPPAASDFEDEGSDIPTPHVERSKSARFPRDQAPGNQTLNRFFKRRSLSLSRDTKRNKGLVEDKFEDAIDSSLNVVSVDLEDHLSEECHVDEVDVEEGYRSMKLQKDAVERIYPDLKILNTSLTSPGALSRTHSLKELGSLRGIDFGDDLCLPVDDNRLGNSSVLSFQESLDASDREHNLQLVRREFSESLREFKEFSCERVKVLPLDLPFSSRTQSLDGPGSALPRNTTRQVLSDASLIGHYPSFESWEDACDFEECQDVYFSDSKHIVDCPVMVDDSEEFHDSMEHVESSYEFPLLSPDLRAVFNKTELIKEGGAYEGFKFMDARDETYPEFDDGIHAEKYPEFDAEKVEHVFLEEVEMSSRNEFCDPSQQNFLGGHIDDPLATKDFPVKFSFDTGATQRSTHLQDSSKMTEENQVVALSERSCVRIFGNRALSESSEENDEVDDIFCDIGSDPVSEEKRSNDYSNNQLAQDVIPAKPLYKAKRVPLQGSSKSAPVQDQENELTVKAKRVHRHSYVPQDFSGSSDENDETDDYFSDIEMESSLEDISYNISEKQLLIAPCQSVPLFHVALMNNPFEHDLTYSKPLPIDEQYEKLALSAPLAEQEDTTDHYSGVYGKISSAFYSGPESARISDEESCGKESLQAFEKFEQELLMSEDEAAYLEDEEYGGKLGLLTCDKVISGIFDGTVKEVEDDNNFVTRPSFSSSMQDLRRIDFFDRFDQTGSRDTTETQSSKFTVSFPSSLSGGSPERLRNDHQLNIGTQNPLRRVDVMDTILEASCEVFGSSVAAHVSRVRADNGIEKVAHEELSLITAYFTDSPVLQNRFVCEAAESWQFIDEDDLTTGAGEELPPDILTASGNVREEAKNGMDCPESDREVDQKELTWDYNSSEEHCHFVSLEDNLNVSPDYERLWPEFLRSPALVMRAQRSFLPESQLETSEDTSQTPLLDLNKHAASHAENNTTSFAPDSVQKNFSPSRRDDSGLPEPSQLEETNAEGRDPGDVISIPLVTVTMQVRSPNLRDVGISFAQPPHCSTPSGPSESTALGNSSVVSFIVHTGRKM